MNLLNKVDVFKIRNGDAALKFIFSFDCVNLIFVLSLIMSFFICSVNGIKCFSCSDLEILPPLSKDSPDPETVDCKTPISILDSVIAIRKASELYKIQNGDSLNTYKNSTSKTKNNPKFKEAKQDESKIDNVEVIYCLKITATAQSDNGDEYSIVMKNWMWLSKREDSKDLNGKCFTGFPQVVDLKRENENKDYNYNINFMDLPPMIQTIKTCYCNDHDGCNASMKIQPISAMVIPTIAILFITSVI